MLDRVVKPQVGLVCSVRSLKEQNNENIEKGKSKTPECNIFNTKVCRRATTHGRNKNVTECKSEDIDFTKPRDLSNRPVLFKNSLSAVNNPDRDDILTHIQYLTDNRRSVLTITRNISALLTLRSKLRKPFRNATMMDMRAAFTKIEQEGWKTKKGEVREYGVWAEKKFKHVIKKFYMVVYGNDEDFREENGKLFCTINESKTDERVIRIVEYRPLLKQWLENHPLKHQRIYPLWVSEATNYKNRRLGIAGAEKIAEEMIAKLDPTKEAKLYTLRHSRATFLAECGWKEPKLRAYFGWSNGSDQPATYIHLSGMDLDSAISALYENDQAQEQTKIILDYCIQCKEQLVPNDPSCRRCGLSTSMDDIYLSRDRINIDINAEIDKQTGQLKQQLLDMASKVLKLEQQQEKRQNDFNVLYKVLDRHYIEGLKRQNISNLDIVTVKPENSHRVNLDYTSFKVTNDGIKWRETDQSFPRYFDRNPQDKQRDPFQEQLDQMTLKHGIKIEPKVSDMTL